MNIVGMMHTSGLLNSPFGIASKEKHTLLRDLNSTREHLVTLITSISLFYQGDHLAIHVFKIVHRSSHVSNIF